VVLVAPDGKALTSKRKAQKFLFACNTLAWLGSSASQKSYHCFRVAISLKVTDRSVQVVTCNIK